MASSAGVRTDKGDAAMLMPGDRESAPTRRSSTKARGKSSGTSGAGGWDRASATTLDSPETCLMSVEYSATNERCLDCRGDFSTALAIAPQSGL